MIASIVLDAASASNQFAVDFYKQVSGGDGNVFFSPISMYVAFSALYEGARGETAEQIRDAFRLDADAGRRHGAVGGLIDHINKDDPYSTLAMANALWVDDDLHFLDSYRDAVVDNYGAHAEHLDLEKDAVEHVNRWIEDNTNGTIKDVLTEELINNLTRLIITNAIYFAGEWETQFPGSDTREADFWRNSSDITRTEIMSVTHTFDYAQFDGFQIVRLPYKGERLSMIILLPDGRDAITDLEKSLSVQNIDMWKKDLKPTLVRVQIPKFEIDSNYDLKRYLENLGIIDAFVYGASDLSGIGHDAETKGGLYVTAALHNGFVKVDEVGTEAAAVTVIIIGTEDAPEFQTFRADRPFVFAIQDDETGALLFMGRVMDPTA